MQCFRGVVASTFLLAELSAATLAAQCPGDVNGDGTVTIAEVITTVNAALTRCTVDPCPGDLNGDHIVTIDEVIKVVGAALRGCAPGGTVTHTPTPTNSPTTDATPTPSATETQTITPTPTLGGCPFTFLDDTLGSGMSCAFSGAFSLNPTCSTQLSALVLSDPRSGKGFESAVAFARSGVYEISLMSTSKLFLPGA